jgi:2'-5' RNA ligase
VKRIFIAIRIDPEPEMIKILSSVKSVLGGERISWTDPANIHLTLEFLGDTEEDLIKAISIMLKTRCSGFGQFSFRLKGTGLFGNQRDPRVVWIGTEGTEKLARLKEEVTGGLRDTGLKTGNRPFRPHITLGRIKSVRNTQALVSALEKYRDSDIQEVMVEKVILYESILKPTGAVYRIIGEFALN